MQIVDLVPDLAPVILAARDLRDSRNTLAQWLPYANVAAVSYRLGRGRRIAHTVPVRAIDAPAVPIRRPGVVEVKGDLPSITPIDNLSEQDLTTEMILAQQMAGLTVNYGPSVERSAAAVALTVDNTLELMRGQLLSTGTISLETEDGTVHTVDFEIPNAQIIGPDTAWDDDTTPAAVFTDIETAHEAFIDAAGAPAGAMLAGRRVRSYVLNKLQGLYPTSPVGEAQLEAYLANRGLPNFFTYDRQLEAYDGTRTRVFPDDAITFLPSPDSPIGRTELGITQHAMQQMERRILTASQVPGLTVVTFEGGNPPQKAVLGSALGMPVLRDNDAIVIIDGLFG